MSSINSLGYPGSMLHQYGTAPYDTKDIAQGASENLLNQPNISQAAQKKLAQQAGQAYRGGGVTSDIGQAALNRALKEMQGQVDGAITFDKIYEHQKYLETKFTVEVKIAMVKLGADPEQEFTIAMNAEGTISVACDDPATKEAVLDFLQRNPSVCEDFGYIQALGNLKRAQQTTVWPNLQASKATIMADAIEIMFDETLSSGAMDYSALTAQFSGLGESKDVRFYTGLSYSV